MSQVSRSCQETQLCALQSRRPGKTSHRLGNVSYASESTNHNVRGMTVQLDHSHSKHSWNVTSLSKSWVIRIHSHIHRVMQCHAYMVTVHFGWIRCNFKMQCQSVLYIFCAKTSASRRSFSCEICIQFLQELHGVISMNLQIQCELDLHSTCLRYHDISRHSAGINDFFSEHNWSFVILSSNVTISIPRLPDSQTSRSRRLGPAELFADLLLRLAASWRASPDDTNWRLSGKTQGGQIGCSESWSFLLLITSSCKSNLQQSGLPSLPSDDLESTCDWVFPKIGLSDLSPNLQDFPGPLAFHESTISSNKPLQYLPCGHAMLFSLFGIWELNSLKSSEQCSNYENLWIHRWGESFTCGEPQTAKEWINNVGHLMYICSAILRLPSGQFAFWRLCISWLKFF